MPAPKFLPPRPRPAGAPKALEGIKVVDFSRMIAGPWCSLALADLGAEVIKIESLDGDDSRNYQPKVGPHESAFYLCTNRNKKSISLDLKQADGVRIARELIARSDVLLENFSNGVMERLGLGYASLAAEHPRLIYCSVSGYGRDDPAGVSRRGYDAMFQAESGFMSMTGEPSGSPMRTTIPVIDLASAMNATNAVLAAIIARDRLGRGQHIDIALFDVAVEMLSVFGSVFLASGEEPVREGNRSSQTAPSDVYQASDGAIFITCGNDRLFVRLAEALNRPDLAEDQRFSKAASRLQHRDELTRVLNEAFSGDTRESWFRRLSAAGVPAAPVRTMSEAYLSPDAKRRELVSEIPHPTLGSIPQVRSSLRLSLTPPVDPVAPPSLGQHSEQILRETLGYSEQDISRLQRQRIISTRSG